MASVATDAAADTPGQAQKMNPMAVHDVPLLERGEASSERTSPPDSFSDCIDAIGMGPFQTRLVIMCGMGKIIDAMEILVITFVLEDIALTFQLSSVEKGLIGSTSFFGMLIGAGFWSIYADKRGRRTAFVLSLSCVFVGGVASAVAPSLAILCLSRIVVGFGVGGNLPVSTALVTEFLPTANRADVLCRITGVFWGLGIIVASLLGLILANVFGPGQEESMWRWFLGVAAIPSAMVAVAYKFLPESPRFLSVMGRHDEAARVLEHVARMNGKLDVLGLDFSGKLSQEGNIYTEAAPASHDLTGNQSIVRGPSGLDSPGNDGVRSGSVPLPFAIESVDQHETATVDGGDDSSVASGDRDAVVPSRGYAHGEEAEKAEAGDVRELFHTPILRRVTLCLWMSWLFLDISYYALTFLLPRYYDEIFGGNEDFVFIFSALLGAAYIPGAYMAMWLCPEHRLGRVGALMWSSYANAVLIVLLALTTSVKALFVPVSVLVLFSCGVPGTMLSIMTPELYSTKYRAVGMGSASVVTRLGCLLSPVLAEVLYDRGGPVVPLLVFGPMMAVTAIFGGMIPIETAGRKLDDDSWDHR